MISWFLIKLGRSLNLTKFQIINQNTLSWQPACPKLKGLKPEKSFRKYGWSFIFGMNPYKQWRLLVSSFATYSATVLFCLWYPNNSVAICMLVCRWHLSTAQLLYIFEWNWILLYLQTSSLGTSILQIKHCARIISYCQIF